MRIMIGDCVSWPQAKISAHVLSPAFLARVDASTKDVATASNAEKHSSLMKLVMEGQMEVISDFGYEGDVGFVQYQAQVMEHSTDVIMQSNTAARKNNPRHDRFYSEHAAEN